jgi:hypothetical protein
MSKDLRLVHHRYVAMRGVVENFHSTRITFAAFDSTGLFEHSLPCPGVVTVKVNVAFSAGWSKQEHIANMRCLACEYR